MAKTESWELADLARGMIMVGLTMRNLHETESKVSSTQRLIQAVDALNYFAHGAVGRRYSERGGGRGVWVTVSLPAGFVKHVDLYASGHGRSHNDALNMFLQDGLLCYMFGYSHFLKGAIAARDHEAAGSQGLGDKKIKSSLAVIFMKFS